MFLRFYLERGLGHFLNTALRSACFVIIVIALHLRPKQEAPQALPLTAGRDVCLCEYVWCRAW